MKLKNFMLPALVILVLGMVTTSCTLMQELFDDKVVTTSDNLVPGAEKDAVPADLSLIDADTRARLDAEGKTVVIVDKSLVKDPTKAVDLEDPNAGDLVGVGLGVANALWPGIAALEGLGLLFSKRKRQHYASAIKQAAPVNGNVEIKEAIVSIGRALGVAHSSEQTKTTFESERDSTSKAA